MTQPKKCGGLGFRDLELLNLALLAQQSWRLLTVLESLCARLLKAVCCPSVDILNADLGSHPFQVWRSILEGRDALSHGIIRRIGDGLTTRVWVDNWIPRDASMRPVVCLTNNPPILVSELIDSSSAVWRVDKLQQNFLLSDVMAIRNIPLCTTPMKDFWAWQFEKKGNFMLDWRIVCW